MKLINIILSIVFLALSFMPCADSEPIHSFEKVTLNNQSNHSHDNDACSPLCVCNCCGCQGFAFFLVHSYTLFSAKTVIDKEVPEYKSIPTSNFYGSIWQPPQIT